MSRRTKFALNSVVELRQIYVKIPPPRGRRLILFFDHAFVWAEAVIVLVKSVVVGSHVHIHLLDV